MGTLHERGGGRKGGGRRLWQVYGLSVLVMSELRPAAAVLRRGLPLTYCTAGVRD